MAVEYTPPSAKQMFILKWSFDPKWKNKNAFIADGSIRTGKTMWMSQAFIYWAMSHFDGMDFIIACKTIASLKRNVIKPLENYLRPRGYNIIERQSDNKMIINITKIFISEIAKKSSVDYLRKISGFTEFDKGNEDD